MGTSFLLPRALFCFWVFILGASAASAQSLIHHCIGEVTYFLFVWRCYFFLLTHVGSESCFFLFRAKAQLGGLTGHGRRVSTNEEQLEVSFQQLALLSFFFSFYIKHCDTLEDVDTSFFHLKPLKKSRLPCVNTQYSKLFPLWLRFGSRTSEECWWRMWHLLCVCWLDSGWIHPLKRLRWFFSIWRAHFLAGAEIFTGWTDLARTNRLLACCGWAELVLLLLNTSCCQQLRTHTHIIRSPWEWFFFTWQKGSFVPLARVTLKNSINPFLPSLFSFGLQVEEKWVAQRACPGTEMFLSSELLPWLFAFC